MSMKSRRGLRKFEPIKSGHKGWGSKGSVIAEALKLMSLSMEVAVGWNARSLRRNNDWEWYDTSLLTQNTGNLDLDLLGPIFNTLGRFIPFKQMNDWLVNIERNVKGLMKRQGSVFNIKTGKSKGNWSCGGRGWAPHLAPAIGTLP